MRRPGLSGADSEAGGLYRACLAAYFAVHVLRGLPIQELDLPLEHAVPETVELEADHAVDDIALALSGGGRVYIQAKRSLTLGTTPNSQFAAVAGQWCQLVTMVVLDPSRDRVGVATSKLGRPLSDLSTALSRGRWRVAAPLSEREGTSHAKLQAQLRDLDEQQTETLLRSAVVIGLDVESGAGASAQLAQQMLENGVVTPGDGAAAWKALCDECRRRSAVRRGFDLSDLMGVLRAAGVALTSDREGAASARRAARDEAVAVYRARLVSRGEELDLTGLGAHLPPVPLAAADAETRVRKTESDRPRERELTWSLRRHGRLLLTGPPGGGKSTTLRASAADFARRPDWPLPVFAKLTDLARELPTTSFHDALFRAATATLDLDPSDIDLVREAFNESIREGQAALFLDALDETRAERHETVRRVRQFLDAVHPDLELVATTREVAYADAAMLELREIAVVAPRHPDRSVRKILEVAADFRGVAELDQVEWVSERQRWVAGVLERDRTLSRTPLIPVVLAVLASKSDAATLPTRRAEILRLVLEDIVRTWEAGERRRGQVTVGVLEGARAVAALLLALPLIGAILSEKGSAGRGELETRVAAALREEFSLARADSATSASEVMSFWDEAGVFVAASDGTVSPRLRLFAEISAAAHLAGLEGDALLTAVASAASDPNQHETLKLAAGLSVPVAAALWEEAASSGADDRLLLTIASAVAEGAVLSLAALTGLARRLVATVEDSDSWPAAVALARLPVPAQVRAEMLERAAAVLTGGALITFRALATVRWRGSGADADEALRVILRAERVSFGSWTVDDAYAEALVGAAERLRSRGEPDLDLIEGALGKASVGVDEKLTTILIEEGRSAAVSEYYGRFTTGLRMARFFEIEREADKVLLEQLATVGEPKALTYRQRRRLDELSDFVATLGLPDASGADVVRAVTRDQEEVLSLLLHLAPLTGLDVDAVGSEAQLVRDALDAEDGSPMFSMLFDDGVDRGLSAWDRVEDHVHLRSVLRAHIAGWRWLAVPAALALAATPDREAATQELDQVFDDYQLWNRQLAGRVLMHLDPHHVDRAVAWITSEDVIQRIVAAKDLANSLEDDLGLRPLVDAALADRDEGVREAGFAALSPDVVDDALRRIAWDEVRGDATGWFCVWCGHTNSADASGCANCSTSGPDAAKAARRLLEALGENVPSVKDHVHRHVKTFDLDEPGDLRQP
jgi:hypothetical protein